jgi:hypothetical protein
MGWEISLGELPQISNQVFGQGCDLVENVVFALAKLSVLFFLASPLANFVSSNTINVVYSCIL